MANTSQLKLIAVDGSSNSDHAIEWFFQHIYREGDQVGIVHVHVLPDLPAFGFAGHPNYEKILETKYFENGNPVPGEYNMRIQESIVKAKGLVDKYKTALQVKGVANPKLFVETMHDSIGNTICQVALKNNASFIVIGQRGLGSIRRTLFGSVSVYVLHHANIPVIVVSPSANKNMSPTKVTVVCIDGSEYSKRAFDWYFENLHRDGNKVVLAHVFEMPNIPIGLYEDGLLIDSACEKTIESSIADSKMVVEKFTNICKEKNVDFIAVLRPCDESVGNTICQISKDEDANNIVIGQRGLGVIRRTLLGSVSDYVLHHSHLPTIVIPPKDGQSF